MAERPTRILLVDDEQSILTLLSYPLRQDGYEVVRASSGTEALARVMIEAEDHGQMTHHAEAIAGAIRAELGV